MSQTRKFLNFYFWQGLSFILGFLSLFIVTPYISANKEIYGVYGLCVSLTIFLSYADLGFLGAAFKFASAAVAQKDRPKEIQVVGFVSFVLFCFGGVYILGILLLSMKPDLIFTGLRDILETHVASQLLLILAISSVNILIQRILQLIVGVRLDDYLVKRLNILSSGLSILSVFWFFGSGRFDIVGYFFTLQLLNVLVSIRMIFIIRTRYDYQIGPLLKAIRPNRVIFTETKNLAMSSFFSTVSWVVYYELDLLFISKFIGVSSIAYYSVCLILINTFRGLFSTLFHPFSVRVNHLVGLSDTAGTRALFHKILDLTTPVVLFPVVALFVLMDHFVIAWVGPAYEPSILIGRFMLLIYIFAYFSYPGSFLLVAKEKVKVINLLSVTNILVFWLGCLATYSTFGVEAVAFFKALTFVVAGPVYAYHISQVLGLRVGHFLTKTYLPILVPLVFLVASLFLVKGFLPLEKNRLILLEVILVGGFFSGVSFLLYAFFSNEYRLLIKKLLRRRAVTKENS